MNAYPCTVTNNSGQTIWIKIIGWRWDMFSMPEWPGPNNDGLLFAAGAQQSYSPHLLEGDRVVVVFDNSGNFMAANPAKVTAPTTIQIGPAGALTVTYGPGGPIAAGH